MKFRILRFASLFLAFVLLIGIGMPMAQAADTPFDDVPQDAWFAEAVAWAVFYGVTEGTSPTTFSPEDDVTRGQFITFLYRVSGEPPVRMVPRFDDVVNPTRFYFRAVQWAATVEVTIGFGGTNDFRPYERITREQIATMLYRFAEIRDDDLTVSHGVLYRFPDRDDISGFATLSISWATTRGIVRGNGGRLLPQDYATRAEALTMLYRHIEEVPFTLPPLAGFDHGSTVNGVVIGNAATRTANDQHVWDFFRDKGLGPHATAGIMGNLFAESAMRPDIAERRHHPRIIEDMSWTDSPSAIAIDERYTAAVNTGTYRTSLPQTHPNHIPRVDPIDSRNSFIFDWVGYGLSQWTYPTRKRNMYDFIRIYAEIRDETFNIGCLDAQLDFFWHELQTDHRAVYLNLRNTTCVLEASNIVLTQFMRPADQGPTVQGRRAGFSLGYFNRFVE